MDVQADQVSDQDDNPSGVDVSKDQENSQDVESKEQDLVPYKTFAKAVSQRKADQSRLRDVETELHEYKRKDAERQEVSLKQQQKYKELSELKQQKIDELEASNQQRERALIDSHKLNAFKESLPGTINNKSYYAFVNLDAIELDTDSGIVDQDTVEKQVNEFVTKHNGLFKRSEGKRLPNEAPEASEPSSYMAELRKCKTQRELDTCRRKWGKD